MSKINLLFDKCKELFVLFAEFMVGLGISPILTQSIRAGSPKRAGVSVDVVARQADPLEPVLKYCMLDRNKLVLTEDQ